MPALFEDLKCDLRLDQEGALFTTEKNRRDGIQFISAEWHITRSSTPYWIRLDEKPNKDSGVTVAGYTESSSMPTQSGEFYVDWVLGYVYFHSSDSGKSVNPQYWGEGSLIDAEDINKITQILKRAYNVTNRLRPYAQETANTTFRIDAGSFTIGQTEVSYLGNSNIRLGTGGEYVVFAMNSGYYNKLLFTITSSGLLKKYEGTAASTVATVTAPSTPAGEMPVCIVTVQDDGTAAAGTINVINETDITDIRLFLQAPQKEHRFLTVYHAAYPASGEIFLNGLYFSESVSIDKVLINARSAPTGGSLTIELMKNGNLTGETAALDQGGFSQTTTLANEVAYSPSDKLSLKTTAIDPGETAEGLSLHIYYYAT